jgi:nitrogen fixation NifU-like protein
MMTQSVKGKTRMEAEALLESFRQVVTGQIARDNGHEVGKLSVFSGVSEYPIRVKCATLAWHALRAALNGRRETISTE